jgi:uncharacterized protein
MRSKKLLRKILYELSAIILIFGFCFITGQIISQIIVKLTYPDLFANLSGLDNNENASEIFVLKVVQFISAFFTFLLPPILIGKFFYKNVSDYLKLNRSPAITYYFLIILFMLAVMPTMNLIISWNESLVFPDFLSELEASLRSSEESSKRIMQTLLTGDTYIVLLVNLIVVAVLPAFGEEFLFRGVIQKFFWDLTKSPHLGIIISAGIFSAIHFQFFGFVPRFLLGVFFGYLVYYGNSLWPAIWAHFFNNALAVIALFMINKGQISEDIESLGSKGQDFYFIIIGLIATVFIGYQIFRTKGKLM